MTMVLTVIVKGSGADVTMSVDALDYAIRFDDLSAYLTVWSTWSVMVTIDGKPYCRIEDMHTARNAVESWRKNWPAVSGKRLEIIG